MDIADTYPNSIRGLVYASGDITIANNTTLTGVLVIGKTLTIIDGNNILTLNYLKTFLDNPPPGFNTGKMQSSPGSWQKKVN